MEEIPTLPDDVLELGRRLIPRPAFLVGCARSGTSILGEALGSHADVDYIFEASPLWNALTPPRPDHRLRPADIDAELATQIYEQLALQATDSSRAAPGTATENATPPLWLEKNPKHVLRILFLATLFPHARFLHIIRDGRDATASLMFRNRGEQWGHLEIPGWRKLLERFPKANHIRCATQWTEAVRTARTDAQGLEPGRYCEVRYEELVREPEATLETALGFLGLQPDDGTRGFVTKIQDETRGSYHARKQIRHFVDNHPRRIGRHTENLTSAQLKDVLDVCGDLLRELGYMG
jgi:hypothetical protein